MATIDTKLNGLVAGDTKEELETLMQAQLDAYFGAVAYAVTYVSDVVYQNIDPASGMPTKFQVTYVAEVTPTP